MNTNLFMKSIFLLCTLLVGVVSAHAEDYDYEWVKVTDLSQVNTDDQVLLIDEKKGIALPNRDNNNFTGVSVTINDGKIADDVPDKIKWTLTKNESAPSTFDFSFKREDGEYLYGYSSRALSVGTGNGSGDMTTIFKFENYGVNGGMLGYLFNCYLAWQNTDGSYRAIVKENSSDNITLFKRSIKNYVKWKRVNGLEVSLGDTEVVVIVDLKTGRAMSNDKGDKNPDAVVVNLNDDKDRILGDVDEKVQWTFTKNGGYYKFAVDDKNLYADSEGLKVGTETTNNEFSFSYNDNGPYMGITIEGTQYYAGVEESMFSNSWKLVEENDDIAKDTQVAIFKKVEDFQKIVTIELAENYIGYLGEDDNKLNLDVKCTGAEASIINWNSSNENVATVNYGITQFDKYDGIVTYYKRGTAVITASVEETTLHDKASAKCTVRVDDLESEEPGSIDLPLTVDQAKELAEKGKVTVDGKKVELEEGVCYYIKGKVSKVNSGLLAMFGDMDFGEMGIGGDDMDLEEMMGDIDFDMDSMGEMGFDMSSMFPGFGSSDGVTYYISDDGTKDNQLKVVNGYERMRYDNGKALFDKDLDLSPGDDVIVCGPLIYSEDTSMFSGMMGNDDDEPKMSAKVGEVNYQIYQNMILEVEDLEVYVDKSLELSKLYKVNEIEEGTIQEPTIKSSDEEIAKWDEDKKELIGIQVGKAKITVKVKVILQEKDPNDENSKEKSYTMKRKFNLTVLSRDKIPAGRNLGDYVLMKEGDVIKEGTRLLIMGTRTKDEEKTNYTLGANNSEMGGGKEGKKVDNDKITTNADGRECIKYEDVPEGFQEIILEQAEDGTSWYLNVGEDENGEKLYLYASVKEKSEETNPEGSENGGGFNMDEMMEMFMPSSGLKVGTKTGTASKVAGVDSLKAVITISNDIATIKYPAIADEDDKNTIVLTSSFDMESMMNMFSSGEDEEGGSGSSSSSSFDMGSFDMFMASFNTKKPADIDGEKAFLPRIFGFVQCDEYPINFGSSEWITIVSDFDVTPAEDVEAYVVTSVLPGEDQSMATLKAVESLKGGEPYLLHRNSVEDEYTMTRTSDVSAPSVNILEVSDRETLGDENNTSVYVLANKSKGVGFYRWTGGKLGSGRVYLPIEKDDANLVHEFCTFFQGDGANTAILTIENKELPVGLYYDIQGRRILNPTNGIHVINGKKVLVK